MTILGIITIITGILKKVFIDLNADDSIVRNIQPQFKTEEEPVINENTETDLEK